MTPEELAAILRWYANHEADYELFEDYYNGDHRLSFATKKFESAFGQLFEEFALNVCQSIVDTVVDFLVLSGFDILDAESGEALPEERERQVQLAIARIQRDNRLDQRMEEVHLEAATTGDGYVVVWPDATRRPTIYPQKAAYMAISYEAERPDRAAWAAKMWIDEGDGRGRLTVYRRDAIYKFVTANKVRGDRFPKAPTSWLQREVPGEVWPIANQWQVIPVFHFANRSKAGELGRSELRGVVPIQDAINKTGMDMLVAQEFVALPQRWATGVEAQMNPVTGKMELPFEAAVDRFWGVSAADATFGQFPGTDIGQLWQNVEGLMTTAAVTSRTPIHYVVKSGDFPSGESLKTAESAFMRKMTKKAGAFGNTWEDVFTLALRMTGIEGVLLSANWESMSPRNEAEEAGRVKTFVESGASLEAAARAAGMSEERVQQLIAVETFAVATGQPAIEEDEEPANV